MKQGLLISVTNQRSLILDDENVEKYISLMVRAFGVMNEAGWY